MMPRTVSRPECCKLHASPHRRFIRRQCDLSCRPWTNPAWIVGERRALCHTKAVSTSIERPSSCISGQYGTSGSQVLLLPGITSPGDNIGASSASGSAVMRGSPSSTTAAAASPTSVRAGPHDEGLRGRCGRGHRGAWPLTRIVLGHSMVPGSRHGSRRGGPGLLIAASSPIRR